MTLTPEYQAFLSHIEFGSHRLTGYNLSLVLLMALTFVIAVSNQKQEPTCDYIHQHLLRYY